MSEMVNPPPCLQRAVEASHTDVYCNLMVTNAIFEAHPLRVLIDSGASCNFMSDSFCAQHCFSTHGTDIDQHVIMGNGVRQPCGRTVTGTLQIGPITESVQFSVTALPHHDMILGHSWLSQHSPYTVNHATLTVHASSGSPVDIRLHNEAAVFEQVNAMQFFTDAFDDDAELYVAFVDAPSDQPDIGVLDHAQVEQV